MSKFSDDQSPGLSPPATEFAPDYAHFGVFASLVSLGIRTIATLHEYFAWKLEWVHALAFWWLCFFMRTPKREAVIPEKTAVVVMGGGEGVGRMLSLKLASAGYTVFACLPHDIPTPIGASSSSYISPLLYIWQSRKARVAAQQLSGTIVPLVLDATQADDCERAKDTILAYCSQHSVSLRTLIVPPITPSFPDPTGGQSGAISPTTSSIGGLRWRPVKRNLSPMVQLVQESQTTLHDAMSRCIFQPLGMVQALAGMLHENKSQVIFVSGCDETSFRPSQGVNALCDAAREQTAGTLLSELGPLGIYVSHITLGPLQRKARRVANTEQSSYGTRRVFGLLSLMWAIDDTTCFKVVRSVVESSYPRSSYRFGLDILAENAWSSFVPTEFKDILKRSTPDVLKNFAQA